MKTNPVLLAAAALLGAAAALLISFAALQFQGGIVADATGGVGELLPVQAGMAVVGMVFMVASAALFIISATRRNQRRSLTPQTR